VLPLPVQAGRYWNTAMPVHAPVGGDIEGRARVERARFSAFISNPCCVSGANRSGFRDTHDTDVNIADTTNRFRDIPTIRAKDRLSLVEADGTSADRND
jgi:hypothetical protein